MSNTAEMILPDSQIRKYTMQQIADYACWHVMTGRGQNVAMLDQRGLDFLTMQHRQVFIALPPDGHTSDDKNHVSFLSVRF